MQPTPVHGPMTGTRAALAAGSVVVALAAGSGTNPAGAVIIGAAGLLLLLAGLTRWPATMVIGVAAIGAACLVALPTSGAGWAEAAVEGVLLWIVVDQACRAVEGMDHAEQGRHTIVAVLACTAIADPLLALTASTNVTGAAWIATGLAGVFAILALLVLLARRVVSLPVAGAVRDE